MKCSDCDSITRLSKEKRAEFEVLARPIIKFMNDNLHPHCHAVIDSTTAQVSEGLCSFVTEDYIKD